MTHTTKHTPGPLKAVQIIIENSPCTWAVQRKSIREQWGKPSVATYIDNEADARLFAAAPAMYEALQQSLVLVELAALEEWGRAVRGEQQPPTTEAKDRLEKVKAALAQAEGRHHE